MSKTNRMKVYSYRAFETLGRGKSLAKNKILFGNTAKDLRFDKFLNFNTNHNLFFQLVSIGLLTVGLLLGFQMLTYTSDVSVLAFFDKKNEVKILNNFGKNIKPSDNLSLKEIILAVPNPTTASNNTTTVPETTVPEISVETITYTVKSGDNLYSIAQEYGIDFVDIAEDNDLERPYNLQIGQQIYLNFNG